MRTNLCLLVVVLVCPAGAWITTAQALFGTKINDIDGLFEHTAAPVAPYNTLGMLWSDSKGTNNPAGLGQAITWAWDDGLCAKLLPSFKSDPFGIPFIDCASIRSSMHRAFSTWAQNHPKITFIETTDMCKHAGMLNENCPYAEIWVTSNNKDDQAVQAAAAAGGEVAAAATPKTKTTTDFVLTNGERPYVLTSSGARYYQPVLEIVGAKIEFVGQPLCWYLDSSFCAVFHRFKRQTNPTAAKAIGASILLTLWCFAVIAVVVELAFAFRQQLKLKAKVFVDRDGDGSVEIHEAAIQALENVSLRLQAFLATVASKSLVGTALRFTLLLVPWPFYAFVFEVCWDCNDFEAAAAHEIGHALGIGHPDKLAGAEIANGFQALNTGTYYNKALAGGEPMNASRCMNPWKDVVSGIPAGLTNESLSMGLQAGTTVVRKAMMETFTVHNPSVCLTQDDYEALLTMYPVCMSMPPAPTCEKADRNLGLLRVALFVVGPFLVALLLAIILHTAVERQRQRWQKYKRQMEEQKQLEGATTKKSQVAPEMAQQAPPPPAPTQTEIQHFEPEKQEEEQDLISTDL